MNPLIFFSKLKHILEGKDITLQGNTYKNLELSDRFFTVWTLFENYFYKHPASLNSFLVENFLNELYDFLLKEENGFEKITEIFYLNQDKFVCFLDRLARYDTDKCQNLLTKLKINL